MSWTFRLTRRHVIITIAIICAMSVFSILLVGQASMQASDKTLVTVYDRGERRSFLTTAKTVNDALKEKGFQLEQKDTVEPALTEELLNSQYNINIYRARSVVVTDGKVNFRTVSAYQTPRQIAVDSGIAIHDEDNIVFSSSSDLLADGAGLRVQIDRATLVKLDLYGKIVELRTHAPTVAALLSEKNIVLQGIDRVMPAQATAISEGMEIRIWREGVQTISINQPIQFGREIVYDSDRPVRYREARTLGSPGVRAVSYEVTIKDGKEIARKEVASVIVREPTPQTDVIGLKNDGLALSLSRGALYFKDSKGVEHRETYYDLPMKVVMGACGAGGYYTVRPDGVKVDREGYIIVAANYGNYPRCSIVETSLGLGKVYDTGGFAARHPHGFDLATDWTKADGI